MRVDDLEAAAAEVLPGDVCDYFAGGAGDEWTLRENRRAFDRWVLRPRVLIDVSSFDTSTTVAGQPMPFPIMLAPTAYQRLAHPDGELATATPPCRLDPKDPVAFVNAIVTYHLVIEGYLALGGQRTVLRLLRRIGILPGFINGFTAVARDESRHIGFGVLALRRRVAENPEMARVIARKVYDLLPAAVDVVIGPDERPPFDDIS